jgi:phospholipid/cholesterol/gamma-HCH transport system substrate-binding protein
MFALAMMIWASLTGAGTSIFDPKSNFDCYFRNVTGLLSGSPVWMSGVEVGNVKSVRFVNIDSLRQVLVTCRVKESVWDMITIDSKVQLGTIGLLGDKYVEIIPGTKGLPAIQEGDVVLTQKVGDAAAMFERGEEAFENIGSVVNNIDQILARMNRGEGTLGKIATDEALYGELTGLVANLTALTANLMRDQHKVVGSIEQMASSISDLSSQVSDNSGTLGKLINDPVVYDNLAATSARLDTIMVKINSAQGSMGLLVNDTALYSEVANLLTRVSNLVTDIEENPRKYFKFSVF